MDEYLFQCLRREVALAFSEEPFTFDNQVRRFYSKYLFPLLKGRAMVTTDMIEKGKVMFVAVHVSAEGPDLQLAMLADKEAKRLSFRSYDATGRRTPLPFVFEALLESAIIAHNKDNPPMRTVGWLPWEKELVLESQR